MLYDNNVCYTPGSIYLTENRITRKEGYKLVLVPGVNGYHNYQDKEIGLGTDLSLNEKVIILAHEIGHIYDYKQNPPTIEESIKIRFFHDNYKYTEEFYQREVNAWELGKNVLKEAKGFGLLEDDFEEIKSRCLLLYRNDVDEGKKFGLDLIDEEEFKKVALTVSDGILNI